MSLASGAKARLSAFDFDRVRQYRRDFREHLYRILMLYVLSPAARWLPGPVAAFLARAIGWGLSVTSAGRYTRGEVQRAFPDGPHKPWPTARAWLTRPFLDHVAARRAILNRPGNANELRNIRIEVTDAAQALFDSDRSFLVANAHLCREAMIGLFAPGIIPRHPVIVTAPIPDSEQSAASALMRVQFGQLVESGRAGRPDTVIAVRGSTASARSLVERLSGPGWAVCIHVDAPFPDPTKAAVRRPFAGWADRGFANGTARIARLAQVPIVVHRGYLDENGQNVFAWSDPIEPPARDDTDADNEITSRMLDIFEHLIGIRPDQYVLEFGSQRSWDPVAERWVAPAGGADDGDEPT